jgi:hypothetical protein
MPKRTHKIWDAFVKEDCVTYDAFVDFIKNTLAPTDNEKAYEIEDKINASMVKMFDELEKEYA